MAADPRVTGQLDDFERADEDPIASPWAVVVSTYLSLGSGTAGIQYDFRSGSAYWTPQTYSGDIEVWANASAGNAPGIAWALDLYQSPGSAAVDGYRARQEVDTGGGKVRLYRVDNGTLTQIGSTVVDGFTGGSTTVFMALIRIAATNTLQVWHTVDNVNWTNTISHVDSTYTGDFYLGMGLQDDSFSQLPGWEGFGGGERKPNRTQIYRWIKN